MENTEVMVEPPKNLTEPVDASLHTRVNDTKIDENPNPRGGDPKKIDTKIDRIDRFCHVILKNHSNLIKSVIKTTSQKNDTCIPEFLEIDQHVKTRFLRLPDENGETDTEVITYCSLERLSIIIEYKIPATELLKTFENGEQDKFVLKIPGIYKMLHCGKTLSFSYTGTIDLDLTLFSENKGNQDIQKSG